MPATAVKLYEIHQPRVVRPLCVVIEKTRAEGVKVLAGKRVCYTESGLKSRYRSPDPG